KVVATGVARSKSRRSPKQFGPARAGRAERIRFGNGRSGAAALGLPGAGALAALPGAGAVGAVQPARAGGALVAVADGHGQGAVVADAAGDSDGAVAGVDDGAAGNADRIAVGAVAGATLGHDHHAPEAVMARSRGRRGGDAADRSHRERERAGQGEIAEVL